ncbi:MAG: hypothetical protein Q9N02_05285, partial [Ghiorsea sp.]|nr:hypothetical protein [Ghiorsea sp.]
HLSLQKDKRNHIELRGKIKESDTKLFAISDMVLQIKDAGSIQISGSCDTLDSCQINSKSASLNLKPISELFNNPKYAQLIQSNSLQNILIQNRWQHGILSNQGQFSWEKLNYQLINPQPKKKAVSIDAGKATFQGLTFSSQHYWHLDSANISTENNKDSSINITSASLQPQGWKVPLQLQHSHLWLPITQIVLDQQQSMPQIMGDGVLTGHIVLKHSTENNQHISFDLDASQSEFSWLGYSKAKNIPLTLQGKVTWQDGDSKPNQLQASIHLADSYANINFKPSHLSVQDMSIDFNHLKSQKITFAQPLQPWHGSIAGSINIDLQQQKLLSTQLQLQQFGIKDHYLTGEVSLLNHQWVIPQLSWQFEKNNMQLTTNEKAQVNITAEQLDTHALYSILQTPFTATGQLTVQKVILPLGILHQ